MHPILFVDLFKQSNYKTAILLSMMHKQLTYFSKKYSKSTKITLLARHPNNLSKICKNDCIKQIKYADNNRYIFYKNNTQLLKDHSHLLVKCVEKNNIKIIRYLLNNDKVFIDKCTYVVKYKNVPWFDCKSLLTYVVEKGSIKIIKLLIDKDKSIPKRHNILTTGIRSNNEKVIKYLLHYGAIANSKDGCDALALCTNNGHEKIAKLLKCSGAYLYDSDYYDSDYDSEY